MNTMSPWLHGFLAATLVATACQAQCATTWQPGDAIPGLSKWAYASTSWDRDGAGPEPAVLVVGGWFVAAGDIIA
ncbi:MAG: hypothetical protein KDC98_20810, partial [Planctomycetes bacterium]|nr:hypothetical protein [Planctomycetota bacterium]